MKDELIQKFEDLKNSLLRDIETAKDTKSVEDLEQKVFGRKKGTFTELKEEIKNLDSETKKTIGKVINDTKNSLELLFSKKRNELERIETDKKLQKETIDLTEVSLPKKRGGHTHPISKTRDELEDIFTSMGFIIYDGPHLESDYYNFEALNIPKDHPARDNQDTFFIKDHPEWCMRTHTSPEVQVRAQHDFKKPVRAISTGRCYRNEATDASHEHTFYQIDGAVIDKNISVAHLKATLLEMFRRYFQKDDINVRLRPGYFPFVEPGFEMDISCVFCNQKGCKVCKHTGWVEMLGCGCLHPNVIRHAGFDPEEYSGYAFGMGIDRITMLKHGIDEIRWFHSGDLRFLQQF